MLVFLLLAGTGFYALIAWIRDDLRPRYLATIEESLVDTATVLSGIVADQTKGEVLELHGLRGAFDEAKKKAFSARIYEMTKTHLSMRVYVTDKAGVVVFDSDAGRDEGKDYSRWNDVLKTLRGEYGARATRIVPDNPWRVVLYVASPIMVNGQIAGVLTVGKSSDNVALFLETAESRIITAGIISAIVVILVGVLMSLWITLPIETLTRYAKAIRDGRRVALPSLGHGEIQTLGKVFEEMRNALEGKQYVEEYVQTLTHQMKSPVSAIRGAAELLNEDMSPQQREQFLNNIQSECSRIQDVIDRMLQLSMLENRKALRDVEPNNLRDLLVEIIDEMRAQLTAKQIRIDVVATESVVVRGERFLISHALANVIQNAVDFSGCNDTVTVSIRQDGDNAEVVVTDTGPGIPPYALDKVFERFYSLPRPDTGRKSSGLGLVFVKEVMILHGGQVRIENRPEGGVNVTLILPIEPSQGVS